MIARPWIARAAAGNVCSNTSDIQRHLYSSLLSSPSIRAFLILCPVLICSSTSVSTTPSARSLRPAACSSAGSPQGTGRGPPAAPSPALAGPGGAPAPPSSPGTDARAAASRASRRPCPPCRSRAERRPAFRAGERSPPWETSSAPPAPRPAAQQRTRSSWQARAAETGQPLAPELALRRGGSVKEGGRTRRVTARAALRDERCRSAAHARAHVQCRAGQLRLDQVTRLTDND